MKRRPTEKRLDAKQVIGTPEEKRGSRIFDAREELKEEDWAAAKRWIDQVRTDKVLEPWTKHRGYSFKEKAFDTIAAATMLIDPGHLDDLGITGEETAAVVSRLNALHDAWGALNKKKLAMDNNLRWLLLVDNPDHPEEDVLPFIQEMIDTGRKQERGACTLQAFITAKLRGLDEEAFTPTAIDWQLMKGFLQQLETARPENRLFNAALMQAVAASRIEEDDRYYRQLVFDEEEMAKPVPLPSRPAVA